MFKMLKANLSQHKPPETITGYFDECVNTGLRGWAADRATANQAVEVEIIADGEVLVRAVADIFREDVKNAGIGEGRHGFDLPVPAILFDGQPHSLEVREAASGMVLEGSPKIFQGDPLPATEELPPPSTINGSFDKCETEYLSGWLMDKAAPDKTLEIEILADDKPVARVRADLFREDLKSVGIGTGVYGFMLRLPAELYDDKPHTIVIREVETGLVLEGSPKVFQAARPPITEESASISEAVPPPSTMNGSFDKCETEYLSGWLMDKADPGKILEIEILADGKPVARVRADLFRDDLKSVGIGTGVYGFMLRLPAELYDDKPHAIVIREVETGLVLEGSPKMFQAPPAATPTKPFGANNVTGSFDTCTSEWIGGWAAYKGLDKITEIEIVADGAVIMQLAADNVRSDLMHADIGAGSGRHGYEIPPPEILFDGKKHSIEIRDAASGIVLQGSPKIFQASLAELWLGLPADTQLDSLEQTLESCEETPLEYLADKSVSALIKIQELAQQNEQYKIAKRVQVLLDKITQYACVYEFNGFSAPNEICGWARDSLNSRRVLTLEALEGQTLVAVSHNDRTHQKHGAGGFTMTLPESMHDGAVHAIKLRIREYGGLLDTWNILMSSALPQYPAWKEPAADNAGKIQRRKRPPHKTELEMQLEKIENALALLDEDNITERYELLCQSGQILQKGGKPKDALARFQAAMELDESVPEAIIAYINTLIALGRENEAEIAVQAALESQPEEAGLLELQDKLSAARRIKASKIIAFYLPQFHPIPENDRWWGKGFTEWTNVGSATPLFDGHFQPRRPADLGYYDLRLPETANAQFDLARRYGIDGFCYYFYWFHGKRLLDRPLQDLVDGKTGPFPFCICWANEDWTRSWDGMSGEVLMGQEHTPESDFSFIQGIAPLLRHPDYIRQDGKPLVIIYRANKLATPKETVQAWREWCRQEGIGELYLCAAQSFGFDDPRPLGFDAAVEFPPHCPWDKYPKLPFLKELSPPSGMVSGFAGKLYDYQSFATASIQRPREPYILHRTCMGAWDNTARRQKTASLYHHFSLNTYKRWLAANINKAALEQENPLVFINAWNEWAEGTVLEPDAHLGYGMLEATRETRLGALYNVFQTYWTNDSPAFPEDRLESKERILLFGHDAFPAGASRNLLNMARCLKRQLHMDVFIFLLNGGDLLNEYERVAPTLVMNQQQNWKDVLRSYLQWHFHQGARKVLCNTVVTGEVVSLLKQESYRVVSLVHELPALIENYALQSACWNLAGYADNLVFASHTVADEFCNRYWPDRKKILISPQGVVPNPYRHQRNEKRAEIIKELNAPSTARIIMGCGHGDMRKGIDLFVQMAGEVTRQCGQEDIIFIWVGELDSAIQSYVFTAIERLDLKNHFHITGLTDDPFRYYIASDVFTLTSREDPFPSVVMEAFDAGLPVIAFDGGGGYVDIVNDNTGALVPYLDTLAMAAVVVALLHDQERRARIGEYCHAFCREHFGYVPYMQKLLALLGGIPPRQVAAGILKHQAWRSDKPRPSISVIVPNYNYGRYLELRLRTILAQTLPPDEIIILDDASTDYSLEIINALAKLSSIPIQVVTNEMNTGNPFVQWAKGLELAKGELIWIAEADDYCEPRLLETLAEEFVDDKVVMAWCDSIIVDDNGQGTGFSYKNYYSRNYGHKWLGHFRMLGQKLIDDCLLAENVVPNASAVLFRRKAAGDDFSYIKQYRFSGDWWFWINLAQAGDVVYSASPLNYHRRHSQSVMGDVLAEPEKLFTETMRFYQRMAEHKPECLSSKGKLQVFDRLEKMYQLFPKLAADYPRLAEHPAHAPLYRDLADVFKPAQAMRAVNGKTPAVLIISQDALVKEDASLALIQHMQSKHRLSLVLIGDKDELDEWAETCGALITHFTHIQFNAGRAVGMQKTLDAAVIQLGGIMRDKDNVISFGLLAHVLTGQVMSSAMEWTVIAGNEFNALLGQLPKEPVTLTDLQAAIERCHDTLFLGDTPPHAFARMARHLQKPIEKLTLAPAGKITPRTDDKNAPVRFLGIAAGIPDETWKTVVDALGQISEKYQRKVLLRILAWGDDLARVQQAWKKEKIVEVVAFYESPREFFDLADVALDLPYPTNHDSVDLRQELSLSGMGGVSVDALSDFDLRTVV